MREGEQMNEHELAEIRGRDADPKYGNIYLPNPKSEAWGQVVLDRRALLAEVERLQALIAAGLEVADILDGDTEWAQRQIRTALTTGAVTDGWPDD